MIRSLRLWVDNPRGELMVLLYRLANFASRSRKEHMIHWVWAVPVLVLYKLITEFILNYEIPAATAIGEGLFIDHGYAIVINKHTIIGRNCRIKHGVTIGCKTLEDGGQGPSPIIGNNVDIGAGAVIIGGIKIGDGTLVAAGAIVTRDVPSGSVVRGEVAKIYPRSSA